MQATTDTVLPYTPVFIRLLKGPVDYLEKAAWDKLLLYRSDLTAFIRPLGLAMVLEESDGYAYLRHAGTEEDETAVTWMQRRPIGYEESLFLILLRDMMTEFEVSEAAVRELVKKRREIKEYAALFFKENASQVRFLRELDRLIDKAEEQGFLARMEDHELPDEQRFRIRKVIKAKVNSETMEAFKQQLEAHAAQRIQHGQ